MTKAIPLLLLLLSCTLGLMAAPPPSCQLAAGGKAKVAIVVSANANASVRHSAEELRDMLARITGATFTIQTGDGRTGLAVGMLDDFPLPDANVMLTRSFLKGGGRQDLASLQSYLLLSHNQGVQVIGASELAVEYGIWDLLYRLGYRQFFPGDVWEVVPKAPTLSIAVDAIEKPNYFDRRISCMGENQNWEWFIRNRVPFHGFWASRRPFLPDMPAKWKQDFVQNSHAYSYIVRDYANVFKAHPDWMALSNGERGKSTFLCISNPDLRQFIAQYAVKYLEDHPETWSVSLEPTDGDGWCECDNCKQMGKISNRPVLLANTAAEAIDKRFPGQLKYVGMYGYGRHWQPPDIPVNDRVVVMVTTSTLCPGEGNNPPMEERLAGWAKQAKHVGVYDYWSLFAWGGWTPGHASAGNLKYLEDVIPRYHGMGARCWLSEADDSWGACGLGYYLSSRLLWKVGDARQSDAIIEDFLDKAFGPAKEPMRAYYLAIDGSQGCSPGNPNAIRACLVRMYPALLRARTLAAGDPAARKRVDHLLLYTRFMELFTRYLYQQKRCELHFDGVTDADVRESIKDFMRFCYQIRNTDMVNWLFFSQSWLTPNHLALKDLAPAGADVPPELTEADVDAIAADAARRYTTEAPVVPDGVKLMGRNGDTVLFDAEGFETTPHAAATSWEAQPDAAGANANPADTPLARWTVEKSSPRNMQVTSAPASAADPGPFAGKQYCRIKRGGGTETNLRALFTPQQAGMVEITWMAHGDPRGDYENVMEFSLTEGSRYRVSVLTRLTGDVCYLSSKGEWLDTGLDYDGLRWEKWQIRYAPGADHFSLSIGNRTVDNLPVAAAGPVDRFEVRAAQSEAKFYVDGITGP